MFGELDLRGVVTAQTIVTQLWDYGWLAHNWVPLPRSPDDRTLIEEYVKSAAFHTSFLPGGSDDTGLHGPFVAARIAPADFVPLDSSDLAQYLESVQFSLDPADDAAERQTLLLFLRKPFEGGFRCYVLNRTESDSALFHEWGSVIWVFRELLFVGKDLAGLDRYVIGYD